MERMGKGWAFGNRFGVHGALFHGDFGDRWKYQKIHSSGLNSRFLTAASPRFGMTILFNLFSFRTAFGLALIRFPNSYGI
jgi:hypothetical protein